MMELLHASLHFNIVFIYWYTIFYHYFLIYRYNVEVVFTFKLVKYAFHGQFKNLTDYFLKSHVFSVNVGPFLKSHLWSVGCKFTAVLGIPRLKVFLWPKQQSVCFTLYELLILRNKMKPSNKMLVLLSTWESFLIIIIIKMYFSL